jgi:UDP-4-amino-4,6-dideoxy-N-acetyl-beta-L-altrosamine transaminase
MLPYGKQSISDEDVARVAEAMRGAWLTTGPTVAAFEDALSAICGGNEVVSCSSGTAALHTAYSALGIGPGDEVVTTPMTFVATSSTASQCGAQVVFADIEPDTGLVDVDQVAALVTERTRVIAAVDYAGQPCDYGRLSEIADIHGSTVLADAAHSLGASRQGRPVGTLADVTTFSFFPTKNITTLEGGAVVTAETALATRAREFRGVGLMRDPDRFEIRDEGPWHQEVHEFGLNYRLTDVASALGLSQLQRLPQFITRRAEIYARYCAALRDVAGISLLKVHADVTPAWHFLSILVHDGRRRTVYEELRAAGIGAQVNYIPVYWHPVYARRGYRRGMCPNAEQFYAAELSLPLYPELTDADVDRVVETLVHSLR